MPNRFQNKTFTLIEMLVVVVIIGILAGVLIPRLRGTKERASDAGRIVKVGQISSAVELYAQEKGTNYPIATLTGAPGISVAKQEITDAISPYLTTIPTDPGKGTIAISGALGNIMVTGDSFAYYTDSAGTMFAITALMESKKGNTMNAVGVVDSDNNGKYNVIGKGLFYATGITYDKERDGDAIQRCINHITTGEINILNMATGKPNTKDYWCKSSGISIGGSTVPGSVVLENLPNLVNLKYVYITLGTTTPTSIMIGNIPYLDELRFYDSYPKNSFTSYTIRDLPNLKMLFFSLAYTSPLTTIEVPNIPSLKSITISSNYVSNIIIPALPNLESISINNLNSIAYYETKAVKTITIPSMPKLRNISIYYISYLQNVIIGNQPSLTDFYMSSNGGHRSTPVLVNIPIFPNLTSIWLDYDIIDPAVASTICPWLKEKGWLSGRAVGGCAGY